MQKITPCLWFDGNVEEAIQFYTSVFPEVEITNVVRYGKSGPGPEGSVLTAVFRLFGQEFMALNGGPAFRFNEAVSFVVHCQSQEEVDSYWEKLTDGGQPSQCGWLKDRFGLSWQIVPTALPRLMSSGNATQTSRVMEAIFKMSKIDIATLELAFNGNELAVTS
jgi:predicted 3-demethylubiquinone-9 3-methyltransferase (glyoxalase superfamily)